ncbi:MAG: RibD family protein [Deltaproteobacteria bacterium]|nr:RibD family protein [Deltaproteobacteria bacterium]
MEIAVLEQISQRMLALPADFPRPWVTLKAGVSLDGKVATSGGESRWITGEAARGAGHRLRALHQAVVVGIGTVLADDPQLTVRQGQPQLPGPARVVVDSTARVPLQAKALAPDGSRRLVVCGSQAAPDRLAALAELGVEVLQAPTPRPAPEWFLPRLRQTGLASLLVEGGPRLHASFIAGGFAHEVFLFMAGMVLGEDAPGWCGPLEGGTLSQAPRLCLSAPVRVEEDLLVHGVFAPFQPSRPSSPSHPIPRPAAP